MKQMKIAILLADIERWSSFHGGACARVVYQTITQKDFENEDIVVFCKTCGTEYEYDLPFSAPKMTKFWFGINKFFRKTSSSLDGWMWILPQYRKLKKFDIIHIHNRPHYTLILRKLGYKGIIINHLQNDFNLSSPKFAKEVVDSSELIISCSENISSRFIENYPEGKSKTMVINNGADHLLFSPGKIEDRKQQILFMGRNDPIKGIHFLLEAYERLLNDFPELILKLTGSSFFGDKEAVSPYQQKIFDTIKKINSEGGNIEHVGYVEYEELPVLLRESQVFCLPSLVHDAFPLVVLEAMFTATPVVATRLGGTPEAVGEFGCLTDANADSIYENLHLLLGDKELQIKNSKGLYERAINNFTYQKIGKKQYEVYRSLLKT